MHTSTGNVFNSHKTIIGFYDNKASLYTLRYGPGYKQRDLLIMEDDTFSVKSARDYLIYKKEVCGYVGICGLPLTMPTSYTVRSHDLIY